MDLRSADFGTQIRELIDRALSRMNTCIPGIVDSFDDATQTATVIPALFTKFVVDDKAQLVQAPPILNVPIVFPFASTAGFALTFPVRKGDPCLLLFAQRAIDNWLENGGIQPTEEGISARHHDLTDAIAIFAPPPNPNVLGSWEANGIELRNRDRSTRITLRDDVVELDGGAGSPKGVVQGACICAFTGQPHPMVSDTVKASL